MHPLERPDARIRVVGAAAWPVDDQRSAVVELGVDGCVVDHAVEPGIGRLYVLGIREVALDRFIGVAVLAVALRITLELEALAVLQAAGGPPVPADLGRHTAPGEGRDVTGLASHPIRVVVELEAGKSRWVRCMTMATLTAGGVARHTGLAGPLGVFADHVVAAAGPFMTFANMADHAREILAVLTHVHVDGFAGLEQHRRQITVLDVIATATEKVAGTAIVAPRQGHALRDLGQVDCRLVGEHHLAGLIAAGRRRLVIGTRRLVADQAIDVVLVAEVVGPDVGHVVTGVALGAHTLVAAGIGAEVVDQHALAERLAGGGLVVAPGPVLVLHELVPCFGMTTQAGLGHLGAAGKRALQFLEFCMVGGRDRTLALPQPRDRLVDRACGCGLFVFRDAQLGSVARLGIDRWQLGCSDAAHIEHQAEHNHAAVPYPRTGSL